MSTPITLTGAYTCTHHNDKQRTECPVCLVATLRAEVERLKRDYEYEHKCLHEVRERCESWKQRAERAEAEVERLRSDRDCEKRLRKDADELRENAIERAERAEADAAAYLKRAESFRKIGDEAETELATERARLDWVFQNCKVEANDYTTGNRDVYYVHDREDLGAAMKEDAK